MKLAMPPLCIVYTQATLPYDRYTIPYPTILRQIKAFIKVKQTMIHPREVKTFSMACCDLVVRTECFLIMAWLSVLQ